ncbi:MAG: acyl-CoA carboxylase subunit beta [Chlamydiia bacterium]|nr:acyl-CoA carboxylase subunit beta [Chlamydiia bacterium]
MSEIVLQEALKIQEGAGKAGVERQRRLNRMIARERIAYLLDDPKDFFEIGLWAAWKMYPEWGELPAAGVIVGIGKVSKRDVMIIANDATVKAGAFFPQSTKKVLRAQKIAENCRLPILYLVDSSGVFLPLQDEIFPDEDDFGRIFRNNAILQEKKIPQIAAIMGNCIAGGSYLPALCDQLLMTEGSGLYLAGPALVKAAIGQVVDTEELGGAKMHATLSGTVDFLEKDDPACLDKIKKLVSHLPKDPYPELVDQKETPPFSVTKEYDARDLLKGILDDGSFDEFMKEYGKTLVTGYAKLGGQSIGVVANQKIRQTSPKGEVQIGGVIYADSAEKAARFVEECDQMNLPILFIQDVVGFMVGKEAEASGIIRAGAKLVRAVSTAKVPKITLVVGNSFGAGNYALCGKAYDPSFIFAWPEAKFAVMGAEQASQVFASVKKGGNSEEVKKKYEEQTDIRYGAARGWVDAIIDPKKTRQILMKAIRWVAR